MAGRNVKKVLHRAGRLDQATLRVESAFRCRRAEDFRRNVVFFEEMVNYVESRDP